MATHHPSEGTQIDFVRAELGAGAALLVECHLEQCAQCAAAVRERQGGVPAPTYERSDPLTIDVSSAVSAILDVKAAPRAMRSLRIGRWSWAGPGARRATVEGAAGLGEQVYLLKARAGARLARHGHPGSEWVLVLKGAFIDGAQRYDVGDVSEHHETHIHALHVTDGGECICLVVNDRPPEVSGLGRWLAPFLRL